LYFSHYYIVAKLRRKGKNKKRQPLKEEVKEIILISLRGK
jgi:hypothetical protein